MGTCCGKQDSMGAYRGPEQAPKGSSSAPPVASPPAQRRKGSIAAYQDGAQSLQKEQQKSWDVLRRIPVLAETFKPENQRKARRGSVVCELKSNEDEQFIRENLSNHPLFSHLSRNQVSEIAAVMEQVEYAPDAPVYHSWELGKDFFLIKKGRVKFTQSGDDVSAQPDGSMGRKMSINMAGLPGAPSSAGSGAAPLPLSPPGGVHASPMMGDGGAADAEGVIELGVGASFGELAAMWSSRRGFTATTMGVCTLFTIDREALRRAITQSFSKARTELSGQKPGMGYFSKVPLLVDLQACSGVELDLSSLADCMGVSSAVQGEVLCTAGGAMDRFMLVTRGEVSVKLDGIGGADGEITLQRGDYLGEACLVRAGLKWTLTATSLSSETSCAVIERDVFRARFDTLALGPGAEGTADTASEVEAEQPLQPSSVAAEREGPLLPCSPGEVPLAMRGRRYAEVLRASAASKYEAAESLGAVADQASSAAEAASAEAAKRQWEGEAPLKEELSTADFNFCCALNSGPLKQSRERLVGNAFWAGTDGWRAGVRVYLCTHRLSGTPYAVRVYDKSALWAEVQSARILSDTREELKLAHSLAHPRLLPLLSCFQDARCLFYVMPFVAGTTVWATMQQQRMSNLPEDWAIHYTVQVCSALRALHSSGIVHRNINPNCILIDANGWLVLGGSMFVRQPKRTSRQYTVCGLPDYLPPEAIQGRGYNRMADIWMLGVLVFEMVMGKPPFNGQDPLDNMRLILTNSSNVEALPGAAQDLVTKLLAPAPQDRLGFASGFSPTQIEAAFDKILMHEWFEKVDTPAVMKGSGETPFKPPAVPMEELSSQREEPPFSMKSDFLNHKRFPRAYSSALPARSTTN